jgi:hypothetical protein
MVNVLAFALAALAVVGNGPETAAPNRTRPAVKREAHELLTAIDRPVRGLGKEVQDLLARGMARSQTFASLVSALDLSDVIVYVEVNRKLPAVVAGRLLFATTAHNGHRYLRVQISGDGTRNMQIAAIAHELQHALEVAEAPEVQDEAGLARHYERIGVQGAMARSYDTLAAQATGRRVLLEVQG